MGNRTTQHTPASLTDGLRDFNVLLKHALVTAEAMQMPLVSVAELLLSVASYASAEEIEARLSEIDDIPDAELGASAERYLATGIVT